MKERKKRGRPKKPLNEKRKTHVIRVGDQSYKKIQALQGRIAKKKSSKRREKTMDKVMDTLFSSHEFIVKGMKVFLVDEEYIWGHDLADARGLAIQNAVKEKRMPHPPGILIYLGDDDGN